MTVIIESHVSELELGRLLAGEQEEDRYTEGLDVRRRRYLSVELLRGHVAEGTHKGVRSDGGQSVGDDVTHGPEVYEIDSTGLVLNDVLGIDIPVHYRRIQLMNVGCPPLRTPARERALSALLCRFRSDRCSWV